MKIHKCITVWLLTVFVASSAQSQDSTLFDHHIHILSQRLIDDWKSIGMTFSKPDEAYKEAITILDKESVTGAFLISMAHLYTTEGFKKIYSKRTTEQRLVAAENDFIAISVASDPNRLVGFYSVNPLRDYAFQELNRCKANPNLTGLKLHLPACGIDIENQSHRRELNKVLEWAALNDAPVLMHLSGGESIDFNKALWFWETIIQPHVGLELYLAHLGSVGGYNETTESILNSFHFLGQKSDDFKAMRIFFDLSGAIIDEDSEEGLPTSDEECARLSKQIVKIGPRHFVFGSDYPVFTISGTRKNFTQRLTLDPALLSDLLNNKSPRFE